MQTLVISGGGMKGIASLGAVVALKRAGHLARVRTLVGTSAGALVAAALATDRAKASLLDELAEARYVPDIDLAHMCVGFGLDRGRQLEDWIARVLGRRAYTFRSLQEHTGYRLVVCATNVSERRAEYFGPETAPDMDVALALRMSCSVPLYFSAVRHAGSLYVDGAVSDNFPLAHALQEDPRAVGIVFKPRTSEPATSLEAFVGALVECSTRRTYAPRHASTVLELDAGKHSAFNFRMSRKRLRGLYASGARQARLWLKKNV